MNWDQIEGKWKEFRGQVQANWGDLTDDDLDVINGRRTELEGRLQKRYGYAKEEAKPKSIPGSKIYKTIKGSPSFRASHFSAWKLGSENFNYVNQPKTPPPFSSGRITHGRYQRRAFFGLSYSLR